MAYLFDSSSVVELLLRSENAIAVTFDEHLLELTFFEVGNSIRKLCAAEQERSRDDGAALLRVVEGLREELSVYTLADVGTERVYQLARDEGQSFYDCAHIAGAEHADATLVTEDGGQRKTTDGYVPVASVTDLLED